MEQFARIDEILPEAVIKSFQAKCDKLTNGLDMWEKTWLAKWSLSGRLIAWYYERKFLKLVKRLKNGR